MSKVSERRSLLLVEDDPLVAEHLIEALNGHDGFHVVARAASIESVGMPRATSLVAFDREMPRPKARSAWFIGSVHHD